MEERIILRVYVNKKTGQRLLTIPKKFKQISGGDYVEIKKIK